MACTFPFNQVKRGSAVLIPPAAFVYGSGSISVKGDYSAVTTADALIHHYRNAITPEASCEARGDYPSLDTAAPDDAGNVWPTLPEELTFELVQTPDGSPTAIRTFSGIVSVEYDTRENKSTISISGCAASY